MKNLNQMFNKILSEQEKSVMQKNKELKLKTLDMQVKILIEQAKETEFVLKCWGEKELKKKGINVSKVKKSVKNIKNFCQKFGYEYTKIKDKRIGF